ncbi:unnamed protein product [Ilex paraguariensis]|uniref:Uncharacterized protein n=1 Tax=Ilex paraguariensis TaxID=185542 RepID=A0ABC8R9S2_9AQUA
MDESEIGLPFVYEEVLHIPTELTDELLVASLLDYDNSYDGGSWPRWTWLSVGCRVLWLDLTRGVGHNGRASLFRANAKKVKPAMRNRSLRFFIRKVIPFFLDACLKQKKMRKKGEFLPNYERQYIVKEKFSLQLNMPVLANAGFEKCEMFVVKSDYQGFLL